MSIPLDMTQTGLVTSAAIMLGLFLKKIPGFPDWCIPFALWFFCTAVYLLILGLSWQAPIEGLLCAGTAVFGHQIVKQTIFKRSSPSRKK